MRTPTAHEARVAVQADRLGQPVLHEGVGEGEQGGFCVEVGARQAVEQDRGAGIDDVEHLHHVELLALRIRRHRGHILEVGLPDGEGAGRSTG